MKIHVPLPPLTDCLIRVPAFVYGRWSVHRQFGSGYQDAWAVSHVQTGRGLPRRLWSYADDASELECHGIAQALERSGYDFTDDPDERFIVEAVLGEAIGSVP